MKTREPKKNQKFEPKNPKIERKKNWEYETNETK